LFRPFGNYPCIGGTDGFNVNKIRSNAESIRSGLNEIGRGL
jgi:hypothetical protein